MLLLCEANKVELALTVNDLQLAASERGKLCHSFECSAIRYLGG